MYAVVEIRGQWVAVGEFASEADAEAFVHEHGLGRLTGRAIRRAGQRIGDKVSGNLLNVSQVVDTETAEGLLGVSA